MLAQQLPTPWQVRLELAERARTSLRGFVRLFWSTLNPTYRLVWGWYHDAMCEFAELVMGGQIRQGLVLVPPGTTKTTIFSVCVPAWLWANDPSGRILVASTDDKNADRDSMATRQLVNSELYQAAYMTDDNGDRIWSLSEEQNAKDWFNTTRNGHRIALSVNGTVVGKKGDRLILDDPNDAREAHSIAECKRVVQWYGEGFFNRVNDFKTACYLVVGQHTGTNDLQSHLIRQGGWDVLRLPEEYDPDKHTVIRRGTKVISDPRQKRGEWLRPERFSEDEKERAMRAMGPLAYGAQHNQKPEKREGRMFDRDKARAVLACPIGTKAVRYWDTAATKGETSCYSVGMLIGRTPEGRIILIDREKGRWNPAERNLVMRNSGLHDMRRPELSSYRLYWEKGVSDSGVERDEDLLQFLIGIPCEADPAKGKKEERAEPFSAQVHGGNVDYLVGDWNQDYWDVMEAFPSSEKDDADATSGGFNKLAEMSSDVLPATADEEDTVMGSLPKGTFGRVV